VSGPLNDAPVGSNKPYGQEEEYVVSLQQQQIKNLMISGIKITRGFLKLMPATFSGGLTTQQKEEIIMLVPDIADGFGSTIDALPFIDRSDGVNF
jgi:hypothetical protein